MGNFDDFIRYGLPGYILLLTLFFLSMFVGIITSDLTRYKEYLVIIGATVLIIGPLIGFIIHQIYFLYFDWRESYTKPSRGCIGIMIKVFEENNPQKGFDAKTLQKYAFLTWKFLTTNYEKDFKIDDLFIKRLRSLRNYSHSFGGIITSNIISVFLCTLALFFNLNSYRELVILVISHLAIFILFYVKRKEINTRLDELEITIVALSPKLFVDYMEKLINIGFKHNDYYNSL